MEYRLLQTDDNEWMPQVKAPFYFLYIEIFRIWTNLSEEPFKTYDEAIVALKVKAKKIETTVKIRNNRQINYYDPKDLFNE